MTNIINEGLLSDSCDGWNESGIESPIQSNTKLKQEEQMKPSNPNIFFKPLDTFCKLFIFG